MDGMTRRGFLGLLAAPAIIKVADLMPIKAPPEWVNVKRGLGPVQFFAGDRLVGNVKAFEITPFLDEFAHQQLAAIARALGLTYEQLTYEQLIGERHARNQLGNNGDLGRVGDRRLGNIYPATGRHPTET